MTKPDDIPQDVWLAAALIYSEAVMLNEIGQKKAFARAILAEREACALVADTHAAMVSHPASSATAEILAKMIRNRGWTVMETAHPLA